MSTEQKPKDERLLIEDYEQAARVTHLYLKDFCDESLPFPAMVADASRLAKKAIEFLQSEVIQANDEIEGHKILFNDTRVLWENLMNESNERVQNLEESLEAALARVTTAFNMLESRRAKIAAQEETIQTLKADLNDTLEKFQVANRWVRSSLMLKDYEMNAKFINQLKIKLQEMEQK